MPESMSKPAQQEQREFIIQRIYTKDISFESPNAPRVFQQEWKPESNLNLNTQVDKLADDLFEVVLTVTVTTKLGGQTAYLAEVKQGGVFLVRGFSDQEMGPMMGAFCPNILFPYAREVITDLVSKGSFPQMALQPVNFEAMYAQHQQEQAQRAALSATEPTAH